MAHDDLARNTGKVLTDQHVALYRDQVGRLHAVSSICTHMGCDVGWDGQDKVWACPCHGSRFSPSGEVIQGPAMKPLAPAPPDFVIEQPMADQRLAGAAG